jgi:hypothetical protein
MLLFIFSAFALDSTHNLYPNHALPEGLRVYTAGALVNLRAAPRADSAVRARLLAATRVRVVEDLGEWVEVDVAGSRGWIARELLSTMGRVTDLDGDGVDERVVIGQIAEQGSYAWLREGARVQRVQLYPWSDPYLADWSVEAAPSGRLLRVDLNQDSCGAYPTVWLSYVGDTLRNALTVEPWADGGYGEAVEVETPAPGLLTVRTEAYGELNSTWVQRACVLTDGVFVCS